MPKFVPVTNTEIPISEQNNNSKNLQKHRDFDNPFQIKKIDRGWGDNNQVGWGVKGSFGNNDKDEHAQVLKKSTGSNKMVKNEKGLWIVAKEKQNYKNNKRSPDYSSRYDFNSKYRDHKGDISDSHESQRRSTSRDRQRCNEFNDRDNDRQRYNKFNDRDNDKMYDNRENKSKEIKRSRSRSCSRDRQKYYNRNSINRKHDNTIIENRNIQIQIQNLYDIKEDKSSIKEDFFKFSAIQIVNRFQEMYSSNIKGSIRLNEIISLFSDNCIISTLKTGKELIIGREKIKKNFSLSVADMCNCMIRLFIENETNDVSYCIDYHNQNTTPIGDRSKPTVLLYRCQDSVFTNIWGSVDPDHLTNGNLIHYFFIIIFILF